MKPLKIALAQVRQSADFEANAATIFRYLERAGAAGVRIICFPEAHTVGYRVDITPPDTPVPVEKLADLHNRVARRCGELHLACILGTETPLETDPRRGKPYNSALVISAEGQILGVHHKSKLTPMDAVIYSPGKNVETFELCGVKVAVVICFEGLRFPQVVQECVRQGAQLIFHPQNNTTRPNDWKLPVLHALITARAAENTIWFCSCNACLRPHQNSRSLIIAPDGQVYAQSALCREQLLIADIDVDRATRAMFNYGTPGFDARQVAGLFYGDTVRPEEMSANVSAETSAE